MQPFDKKRSVRIWGLGIAVGMAVLAGALGSSCVDTKTNFCEKFGLRCKEGQECAANQAICIDIGGCGNAVIDPGEACDDGNIIDGEMDDNGVFVADACSHDCTSNQECGNAIKDMGEECDDGVRNGDDDSFCNLACRIVSRRCGNGVIDAVVGEQCDPGPMDSATCNSSMAGELLRCKISRCGDGYRNMAADEECDTQLMDTPQCNGKICTNVICGDDYINRSAGETCEGGGGMDTAGCNGMMADSVACHAASCGDGYVNKQFTPPGGTAVEACDNVGGGDTTMCNGNNGGMNGPGSCQTSPTCGDGYRNTALNEQCDALGGNDTATCNGNTANIGVKCHAPSCGDGYVNAQFKPPGASAVEECDNQGGGDTSACNGNNKGMNGPGSCRASTCGDSYHNMIAGEACDGGMIDTATCNGGTATKVSVRCKFVVCGDGYVNTAIEDCDPPNGNDTPACNGNSAGTAKCKFASCGDGYKNTLAGEACDPGPSDSSGCNGPNAPDSVKCKVRTCGDGYVNLAAEQCEGNGNGICDWSSQHCDVCQCANN